MIDLKDCAVITKKDAEQIYALFKLKWPTKSPKQFYASIQKAELFPLIVKLESFLERFKDENS